MQYTNLIPTVVLLMTCTSTAISQTPSRTSPPGFVSAEGNSNLTDLFSLNSVRFQQVDNLSGAPAVFKSLDVRFDGDPAFNHSAPPRSWSNIEIRLGHSNNFSSLSPTFAANYTGAAVQVFTGPVVFPGRSGLSSTTPNPWGPTMRFPFISPFIYNPTRGKLVTEFLTVGNTSTARTAIDGLVPRKNYAAKIGPGCHPGPAEMKIVSCFENHGTLWRMAVNVIGASTNSTAGLVFGLGGVNGPPGPFPCPCPKAPGVQIWLYPKGPYLFDILGTTSAAGAISKTFESPPITAAVGQKLHMQAWTPHPAFAFGFSVSSGESLTIAASTAPVHIKSVVAFSSIATSGQIYDSGAIIGLAR